MKRRRKLEITPKFYQMWLIPGENEKPTGFLVNNGKVEICADKTSGVFIGNTSYEASDDIAFSRHIVNAMDSIKKSLEKTLPRDYEIFWARANSRKTPFSVNLNDIRSLKSSPSYTERKIYDVSIFRFEKKEEEQ
jgi:hypothetical protein